MDQRRVMIDCGLFQERVYESRNWGPPLLPPSSIDALVLTHAHVDHCGLLPRLVAQGFSGPIITTQATAELLAVMLRDSAKIQLEDANYKIKRHRREGRENAKPQPQPLYTLDDAEQAIRQVQPEAFRDWITVVPNVRLQFHDAGHILGSASLEFDATEGSLRRTVIFSGDIGQWNKPIIPDPAPVKRADYVVMESTYGDREHQEEGDVGSKLGRIIQETSARGGKVVIPIFALERAQELMYHISRLVHEEQIPKLPVYVDSPMAVDVTEIFRKFQEHFDEETWKLIKLGEPPLQFPGLKMTRSTEESRLINDVRGPAIIMSTAGMCNAGRIKHHLRQTIENPKNTLLFVGYQGEGTLGRQILDGKPRVRIHGREFHVKAKVERIYGFSAHGDRTDLLRWLGHLESPPKHVYLTHGEEDASLRLAHDIQQELKFPVTVPQYESAYDIE
ncbi:MAG: MBL fold metallo-hydrolase [Planctomycetota bacterium]|nr:MBL fold metallo-hydrolase [Planctomycetota bacterium]MDA1180342.1 MBL fold metallo-hydrolase [Planctomycetota bacterium]